MMGASVPDQALAVPATPAKAVDGPSGFDPSRWHREQREFAKQIADEIVRDAGCFGLGGAAIHAGAMIAAGRIWLRENPNAASAGEAQRAETTEVEDGADT
jgi:hypothetical protein